MTHARTQPPQRPASRGRPFRQGNPGRKPGSRNRASVVVAALGKNKLLALEQKAEELALNGDVTMLKFFLGRLLPRDRPIKLDLPRIVYADDLVAALSVILVNISEGKISPREGADLAVILNSTARAIDIADLVKRLDMLRGEI